MGIKIGPTLKELIEANRYSIKEISRSTNVPPSTIAEWLNNRSPKNPEQTQKVAKYLGVSLHYLLFGVEDSEEPLHKLLTEDVFSGTFEINIKRVRIQTKR